MSKVKEYYLEEEYNPIEAIDKLQQENTKLRIQISAREEEYIKLQEENIKLKELCNKYEEEHNNAFKLWTMKMEEMPDYEERMNYKSRNEKAIEYIGQHFIEEDSCKINKITGEYTCEGNENFLEELLDILKGDNK